MKVVDIFTDGSCFLSDNGRGGYGTVLISEGEVRELYGGYYQTTNNRMELLAVIRGLQALHEPSSVTVYSDSRYVVESVSKGWLPRWVRKDFKNIKNPDLWKQLYPLLFEHEVEFQWVKGHSGIMWNERADELAAIGAQMDKLILDRQQH